MTDARAVSILVVDDELVNVQLLERILRRAGYTEVRTTTKPEEAIELAVVEPPDIVLLDLHMPQLNGVDVLQRLNRIDPFLQPFVIMLTGDASREAKAEAYSAGAKDFITKPFETAEVLLRIRNLRDLRLLHKQLQRSNADLEEKVRARTAELEATRLEVVDRLAMAAEFRDDATGQHTRRVGVMSGRLAHALGMSPTEIELITRAAPLHDVGKIAIPDHILLKPGPLDAEEMKIMRSHTTTGAKLLSAGKTPLLETARAVALTHHERWDGSGYPERLAGSSIPIAGRIVAIADFFDALSHDRPYRDRFPITTVLQLIGEERGRQFDPDVTDAFFATIEDSYDEDLR